MTSHSCVSRAAFLCAVGAVLLNITIALAAPPEARTAALWKWIYYPRLDIPGVPGEKCSVMVGSGAGQEPGAKPRLYVAMVWSGRNASRPPEVFLHPKRMSVRMHAPNGAVTDPQPPDQPDIAPAISNAGGISYSRTINFPWSANALDEAWFECRLGDRVYWLEVPYGFVRDPLAPLAPPVAEAGPAKAAPAMKQLGAQDRVVPWSKIEFDLGVIQNGWRLGAEAVNGEETTWSTILYRETGPWTQDEAKIWPRIVDAAGDRVEAKHLEGRIPDIFRRVNDFSFEPYRKDGRSWGTLTITVEDKPNRAVIPASLYKQKHAATGRDHPQRLSVDPKR
jgi:hypothetical protein